MMVTIGGRSTKFARSSASSSSSNSSTSSNPTNSTSNPNSLATSSITSASKRWLIETMIPKFIHLLMISAKLTSIKLDNSLTVTNSVTCNLLSLNSFCSFSAASSLFARRYLDFKLLPRPPWPDNLACVSLILS